MSKKVDAVNGPLVKLIFVYAVPLILTTIVQSLFGIADKAVLGHMAGNVEVAAVGATANITTLILNGAVGLSTGTSIILARYVGQKNDEKCKDSVDTSVIVSIALGVILSIVGYFLAPTFLKETNCPTECYDGALLYVRIYLAAAPATMLYNYGAAILRTIGDTKRPLLYIMIAEGANVTLNIILCLILENKVLAVAIATITSRIISGILVFIRLCKLDESYKLNPSKITFNFKTFLNILRFGVPTAISNSIIPLANLQITTGVNSYGVDAVAGTSASTSISSISMAFCNGFAITTSTFIGQNLGANNVERVKKSFWYTLGFNVLISGLLGYLSYLTGETWLALILGDNSAAAIEFGMRRMFFVTQFMFVNAINASISRALQAFGYPLFTSISIIFFTLILRIIWMNFIYPLYPAFDTIMLCFTVSWVLNMIFFAIFFIIVYYRYVKKGICKAI